MVSTSASKLTEYRGTSITNTFISGRPSSWQAHLMRISSYMNHGEGIWWQRIEDGFKFNDGADDLEFLPCGPHLDNFRSITLPDIYCKMSQDWDFILRERVEFPLPSIRVYNVHGNYQYSTSSLSLHTSFSEKTAQQTSTATALPPETITHQPQTSALSPTQLNVHATPRRTFCLSSAKLHATPQQTNSFSSAELHANPQHTNSLSPAELHATPQHTNSLSSAELHTTPQQTQITCCSGVVYNSFQQNSSTPTLNKTLLPSILFLSYRRMSVKGAPGVTERTS